MITTGEIRDYFEELMPKSLKMDFDNVGLLAGSECRAVTRILTSLDITGEVISEAQEYGAQLIISHHPLFFSLKHITDEDISGRQIIRLLSSGISALCLHTNLDAVHGGINDELINTLGATPLEILDESGTAPDGKPYGLGRIGCLIHSMDFSEFLRSTATALNAGGLRYYDAGKTVSKIACCGGSGGDYVELAFKKGCDTYVTSDIKYNQFLLAKELGINIIDGGHFCTENMAVRIISGLVSKGFPEVEIKISQKHGETPLYYSVN